MRKKKVTNTERIADLEKAYVNILTLINNSIVRMNDRVNELEKLIKDDSKVESANEIIKMINKEWDIFRSVLQASIIFNHRWWLFNMVGLEANQDR